GSVSGVGGVAAASKRILGAYEQIKRTLVVRSGGDDDLLMMAAVELGWRWEWWRRRCGGGSGCEGGGVRAVVVTVGGDDGDGSGGVWVVVVAVAAGGRKKMARGREWYNGSGRSRDEKHFWAWPENSPEKFSGGGRRWPEVGRRWLPEMGEERVFVHVSGKTEKLSEISFHIKLL
ncbi:hypothetical protein Tco_0578644, partial [Tanacetum coccineum]